MLEKNGIWSVFCGKTSTFLNCLLGGVKKPKRAFTLTEMLIALVVVAVLAVLILPVVTTRAQNKSFAMSYESQIKQLLNSLTGLHVMENKTDFRDTMMYVDHEITDYSTTSGAYINKYMKVSKYCNNAPGDCFAQRYYEFNNNDRVEFDSSVMKGACALLKNGSSICLSPQIKTDTGTTQEISGWIDLNGPKGPNVYGRDLRTFRINMAERVAYSEEDPLEVIMPESSEGCIGSACPSVPDACIDAPLSEECCKKKEITGPGDMCCGWYTATGSKYHDICFPGEEEEETNCSNHTITGPEDSCCTKQDGKRLEDPKCCRDDDIDSYCCKTANNGSLKCCQEGIKNGTITLNESSPCCKYPEIYEANPTSCMGPCEYDKLKNKEAYGDNWRKGPSEAYSAGVGSYCCDYVSRRKEIIKIGNNAGYGPEDGCCMLTNNYYDSTNPISAKYCCRLQKFPGNDYSDVEDLCCLWRFKKKDLDGKNWLKRHDYYANPDDNLSNNLTDKDENGKLLFLKGTGENKFDTCCPYALSKIATKDSDGKWTETATGDWSGADIVTDVWNHCCSLGSLAQKGDLSAECCHFFVTGKGTKYGRVELRAVVPNTDGRKGVLRDACCGYDEFKDYPECCSADLDGLNVFRPEGEQFSEVCCMPGTGFPNGTYTSEETSATGPSPECCVKAGEKIANENKKWFWSSSAKFSDTVNRLGGCCNQGSETVDGKALRKYDKWLVNCCYLRYKDSDAYENAADFVRGCCSDPKNYPAKEEKSTDVWPEDEDNDHNEDCCLAYGSTDDPSHSHDDARWYNRCCQVSKENSVVPHGYYYNEPSCCEHIKWTEELEVDGKKVGCCKSAYTDATRKNNKWWHQNCCEYREDYETVVDSKGRKGYKVYVQNCCYSGKETALDGDRKQQYGLINNGKTDVFQHTYTKENDDYFFKYCCDSDIVTRETVNAEEGAEITTGAPSEKCCSAFFKEDKRNTDYDGNTLSEEYRGICCRQYGGDMRDAIEEVKKMSCSELWMCQSNGTDKGDEADANNNPGYGLPTCCETLKSHNKHETWKNSCCEHPTSYENNATYRQYCCSQTDTVDYTRVNVAEANKSERGLDDANQRVYCCKPDIAEPGEDGKPKAKPDVNCCKYFKGKSKDFKKSNDKDASGKDVPLSENYQIECCRQTEFDAAVNSDNDYCPNSCEIRWKTGQKYEYTPDAYSEDAWKQYNFSGCCKDMYNKTSPFHENKVYNKTDMWRDNCCNYIGKSAKDVNTYYGSHEIYRAHCCGTGEAPCVGDGCGSQGGDDTSCPTTPQADKATEACCATWGTTLNSYSDAKTACCNIASWTGRSSVCGNGGGDDGPGDDGPGGDEPGPGGGCGATPTVGKASTDCCAEWGTKLNGDGEGVANAKSTCCDLENDWTGKNDVCGNGGGTCSPISTDNADATCCSQWYDDESITDTVKGTCCSLGESFQTTNERKQYCCSATPSSEGSELCCGVWASGEKFPDGSYIPEREYCCNTYEKIKTDYKDVCCQPVTNISWTLKASTNTDGTNFKGGKLTFSHTGNLASGKSMKANATVHYNCTAYSTLGSNLGSAYRDFTFSDVDQSSSKNVNFTESGIYLRNCSPTITSYSIKSGSKEIASGSSDSATVTNTYKGDIPSYCSGGDNPVNTCSENPSYTQVDDETCCNQWFDDKKFEDGIYSGELSSCCAKHSAFYAAHSTADDGLCCSKVNIAVGAAPSTALGGRTYIYYPISASPSLPNPEKYTVTQSVEMKCADGYSTTHTFENIPCDKSEYKDGGKAIALVDNQNHKDCLITRAWGLVVKYDGKEVYSNPDEYSMGDGVVHDFSPTVWINTCTHKGTVEVVGCPWPADENPSEACCNIYTGESYDGFASSETAAKLKGACCAYENFKEKHKSDLCAESCNNNAKWIIDARAGMAQTFFSAYPVESISTSNYSLTGTVNYKCQNGAYDVDKHEFVPSGGYYTKSDSFTGGSLNPDSAEHNNCFGAIITGVNATLKYGDKTVYSGTFVGGSTMGDDWANISVNFNECSGEVIDACKNIMTTSKWDSAKSGDKTDCCTTSPNSSFCCKQSPTWTLSGLITYTADYLHGSIELNTLKKAVTGQTINSELSGEADVYVTCNSSYSAISQTKSYHYTFNQGWTIISPPKSDFDQLSDISGCSVAFSNVAINQSDKSEPIYVYTGSAKESHTGTYTGYDVWVPKDKHTDSCDAGVSGGTNQCNTFDWNVNASATQANGTLVLSLNGNVPSDANYTVSGKVNYRCNESFGNTNGNTTYEYRTDSHTFTDVPASINSDTVTSAGTYSFGRGCRGAIITSVEDLKVKDGSNVIYSGNFTASGESNLVAVANGTIDTCDQSNVEPTCPGGSITADCCTNLYEQGKLFNGSSVANSCCEIKEFREDNELVCWHPRFTNYAFFFIDGTVMVNQEESPNIHNPYPAITFKEFYDKYKTKEIFDYIGFLGYCDHRMKRFDYNFGSAYDVGQGPVMVCYMNYTSGTASYYYDWTQSSVGYQQGSRAPEGMDCGYTMENGSYTVRSNITSNKNCAISFPDYDETKWEYCKGTGCKGKRADGDFFLSATPSDDTRVATSQPAQMANKFLSAIKSRTLGSVAKGKNQTQFALQSSMKDVKLAKVPNFKHVKFKPAKALKIASFREFTRAIVLRIANIQIAVRSRIEARRAQLAQEKLEQELANSVTGTSSFVGSSAVADTTITTDQKNKDGVTNDSIRCCVPNHENPTFDCCKAFKDNKIDGKEYNDFDGNPLSHNYKLACCNLNESLCPKVEVCDPTVSIEDGNLALDNCRVREETNDPKKWAITSCCACLRDRRVTNEDWKKTCCPYAKGGNSDTLDKIRENTNKLIALKDDKEYRTYCCVNGEPGSNGAIYSTKAGDQDERCCNYTSGSNANSFCCGKKKAGKNSTGSVVNWIITQDGNEASEFRNACCSDVNDEFCTCNGLYGKYNSSKTINQKFGSNKVTCCGDLNTAYSNKTGETKWKEACCPVAVGNTADVVGTDASFRSLCCNSSHYSNYYNFDNSYEDRLNYTGSNHDERCCKFNEYRGPGMPGTTTYNKGDKKIGSGNAFCCSDRTVNKEKNVSTNNGSYNAACCSGEGVRFGSVDDPQCCTFNPETITRQCCEWRRDGVNSLFNSLGEKGWTPWIGSLSSDRYRENCCTSYASSDKTYKFCTCEYNYANNKSQLTPECCSYLHHGGFDVGSHKTETAWKTNCCKLTEPGKSLLGKDEWQPTCCTSKDATDSSGNLYYNNGNIGCCTYRKDNNIFDRLSNDFTNTSASDGCCSWWSSNDETTYHQRCCHNNSTNSSCCVYMHEQGNMTPFYLGSPCCSKLNEAGIKEERCMSKCEHYAAGHDYYYGADGKKALSSSDKNDCCTAAFNNESMFNQKPEYWLDTCCTMANGDDFVISSTEKRCCSRRKRGDMYGGRPVYFYTAKAFNAGSCAWDDANCSIYGYGNWACSSLTCRINNSDDYNDYCCINIFSQTQLNNNNSAMTGCCALDTYYNANKCFCDGYGLDSNPVLDTVDACNCRWDDLSSTRKQKCCQLADIRANNLSTCCGTTPNSTKINDECCDHWTLSRIKNNSTVLSGCCGLNGNFKNDNSALCKCGVSFNEDHADDSDCCTYWGSSMTTKQKNRCKCGASYNSRNPDLTLDKQCCDYWGTQEGDCHQFYYNDISLSVTCTPNAASYPSSITCSVSCTGCTYSQRNKMRIKVGIKGYVYQQSSSTLGEMIEFTAGGDAQTVTMQASVNGGNPYMYSYEYTDCQLIYDGNVVASQSSAEFCNPAWDGEVAK